MDAWCLGVGAWNGCYVVGCGQTWRRLWCDIGSAWVRSAFIHSSPPCNEKWDKWNSMVYGNMDAESCRKRHRNYVKRQRRAADKSALLKWRSLEMHADEYREIQERRRQGVESSAHKAQTSTSSSDWSRRFEKEWRAFEKKFRGKSEAKYQAQKRSENAPDSEDPVSGATGSTYDNDYCESDSARYRRQFWSSSWRGFGGFGGGVHWNDGTSSNGERSRQWSSSNDNIGSPADRLALGLSAEGPLSLDQLKLAFRQRALTWHPDRHHGDQKQFAEANFKRVGNAYRTLRELL